MTYNTYTAPQAVKCSRSGDFVTDRTGVQPTGCSPNPAPTDFDLRPNSHTQPGSAVKWSLPWITTHLPTPKVWKAELAYSGLTCHKQFTHTMVTCQP